MKTDNPQLRQQLSKTLDAYKQRESADTKSLQRITEKGRNIDLKFSTSQVKLIKSVIKDAKKYSLLCEDLDRHIEYGILEEVIYSQVVSQTKF